MCDISKRRVLIDTVHQVEDQYKASRDSLVSTSDFKNGAALMAGIAVGTIIKNLESSCDEYTEQNPGCGCRKCLEPVKDVFGNPLIWSRMIVCADCGNKRCPHANDHNNDCTYSNEPGQPGSAYAGFAS